MVEWAFFAWGIINKEGRSDYDGAVPGLWLIPHPPCVILIPGESFISAMMEVHPFESG